MRTPTPTGDPLFDEFWEAYPKKCSKPEAIRAFAKTHMTRELDRKSTRLNSSHAR